MQIEILKAKDYYDFRTNCYTGETRKVGLCEVEFKIDNNLISVTTGDDREVSEWDDFYQNNELVKLKKNTLELLNAELRLFKVKQVQSIRTF